MSKFTKNDYGKPNVFSRIVADDKSLVLYRPKLNKITGGITSTILLQQTMYWAERSNNDFYKFIEPCDHPAYVEGDSWCEELGFTRAEFNTAIKRVGYKLGKMKDKKNKIVKEKALIIYYTDSQRLTHYSINWYLLNKLLNSIYLVTEESSITKETNDCSITKETEESGITIITETNTETNTETTSEMFDFEGIESPKIDFLIDVLSEGKMSLSAINTFLKPVEFKTEGDILFLISKKEYLTGILKRSYIHRITDNLHEHYKFKHIRVITEEEQC